MDRALLERAGLTTFERNCVVAAAKHKGRLHHAVELIVTMKGSNAEKVAVMEEALDSAREKIRRAAAHQSPLPVEKPRTFRPHLYAVPDPEEQPVTPKPSTREPRIVALLEEHGQLTAREVAERMGDLKDDQAATALSNLVRKGLVHRAGRKPNPGPGTKPFTLFAVGPSPSPPVESAPVAAAVETGAAPSPPPAPPGPASEPAAAAEEPAAGSGPSPALVAFLYLVMRDLLPTGKVRSLIDQVTRAKDGSPLNAASVLGEGRFDFSAPELEALAARYARELSGIPSD